jgi:hypothetical protein
MNFYVCFLEWVTWFRRQNCSKRGYIYANLTEIVLPRIRSTVIPERTSGKKSAYTVREKERKKQKCSAKLEVWSLKRESIKCTEASLMVMSPE